MKHLTAGIKRLCLMALVVAALALGLARPSGALTPPAGHIAHPILCDGQETHG